MTAPTLLLVVPQHFCCSQLCGAPVSGPNQFCNAECEDMEARYGEEMNAARFDAERTRCVVCGTWSECGGTCSKGCYDLWTAPCDDDDYRNFSPFFRSF